MNLDKTKVVLKKINRLYELINDIGEASMTEKDLLKAYVIDLYDAVTTEDSSDIVDLEAAEMQKKLKKQRKLEKKLKKKEEKLQSKKASAVAPAPVEPETIEKVAEPKPLVKAAQPAPSQSVKVTATAQSGVSEALKELFEVQKGNELSDRLSQQPITDLTKAMAINEKIFTVNELFGGNSDEMNNMLVALNGLNTFDEAKSILMRSVAAKYDWASSAKVKKARTFIKMVQRRYN